MSEQPGKLSRVALYARVSSEEQKEGQNILSQVNELENFVKDPNRLWQIVDTYKDDGWTGGHIIRPDLDRLRDDAKKGLFDFVVINDVDRLARDAHLVGVVTRDLQKYGVEIIFRKLPSDNGPTGKLLTGVLANFAEFERAIILDRTRRGRKYKVEVLKKFIGTRRKYGFIYYPKNSATGEDGRLEILNTEMQEVIKMFDWVDNEKLSARSLVKKLNDLNIPAFKGGRWSKSSVLNVLRCEMYTGVWHYNKHYSCEPIKEPRFKTYHRSLKSSRRLRPKNEWTPVTLPPELHVISREKWERVQEQLKKNKVFSPRNSIHKYLLSGLVFCGGDGKAYVGQPCHDKFYYRCSHRCKAYPSITEHILDEAVWSAVKEAVLNPQIIINQIEKVRKKIEHSKVSLTNELDLANKALVELQNKEDRLVDVYSMNIINPQQLKKRLDDLHKEKVVLEEKIAKLNKSQNIVPLKVIKMSVYDYLDFAKKKLEKFAFEEKQKLLRLLINDIIFEGTVVKIRGIIPVTQKQEVPTQFSGLGIMALQSNIAATMPF